MWRIAFCTVLPSCTFDFPMYTFYFRHNTNVLQGRQREIQQHLDSEVYIQVYIVRASLLVRTCTYVVRPSNLLRHAVWRHATPVIYPLPPTSSRFSYVTKVTTDNWTSLKLQCVCESKFTESLNPYVFSCCWLLTRIERGTLFIMQHIAPFSLLPLSLHCFHLCCSVRGFSFCIFFFYIRGLWNISEHFICWKLNYK